MKNKTKWYNDKDMVGSFLLFIPPVGLYGIYRSETIESKWKLLTSGILILVSILLAFYLI